MFKTLSVAVLVSCVALCGSAVAKDAAAPKKPSAPYIAWHADLTKATNLARTQGKPLVIVFVCPLDKEKCRGCKIYRHRLFAPEFQKFHNRAVFAMCPVRKGGSAQDQVIKKTVDRLGIKKLPTLLLYTWKNGKAVNQLRATGPLKLARLINLLEERMTR